MSRLLSKQAKNVQHASGAESSKVYLDESNIPRHFKCFVWAEEQRTIFQKSEMRNVIGMKE